jgi:hypothetical protein
VKPSASFKFKQRPATDTRERTIIMRDVTQRVIIRWIHIICAIPITGYIYSPFAVLPDYATPTRFVFVFFPVMVLSGLWMWKGYLVRRLVSRAAIRPDPAR